MINKVFQIPTFTEVESFAILNFYNEGLKPCDYTINAPVKNIKPECYQLPYNDDTQWIYDRLYTTFLRETGINYYDIKLPFSLLKYETGCELEYHVHNAMDNGNTRWIMGVQLNDNYDGGEHNYFIDNIKYTLDKKIGNITIYESTIPHEVTPILDGTRWYLVKELDVYAKRSFI